MQKIWIMILIIVGLVVPGCSKEKQVEVRLEKDQFLSVRVGQIFKVELKANPTTGYLWQVDPAKAKGLIAESGKSFYERQGELVGSGGIEAFTFKAEAEGIGDIVFIYERPWEAIAIKKYILTVKIKK